MQTSIRRGVKCTEAGYEDATQTLAPPWVDATKIPYQVPHTFTEIVQQAAMARLLLWMSARLFCVARTR